MKSLDSTNKEILKLLKEDGRLSYRSIAHRMGMEGSSIRKRVMKLAENGIIEHRDLTKLCALAVTIASILDS